MKTKATITVTNPVTGKTTTGDLDKLLEITKGPRVISAGVEELPVKLTDEELLARGQDLAKAEAEMRAHEDHASQVKQQLKAEEARLAFELIRLAGIVRRKEEPRPVDVEFRVGKGSKVGQYVRLDTGELLRDRALTEAEFQGELFAAPEKKE